MASFLDTIMRWFGLSSPAESQSTFTPEDADLAIATLEEPEQPEGPVWWIPIGAPVYEQPDYRSQVSGADVALHEHLSQILDNPDVELPQIPAIAQRALVLTRNDDVDYRQLSAVVEQDPVLTAEFLRVANSVAFRGTSEVRRLDLVFARLGSRRLRSLLLAATLKGEAIRTGPGPRSLGQELWRRSVASSVVASSLCSYASLNEEEAFLLGLLHDIGLIAVLKVVSDYQRRTSRKVARAVFDSIAQEWHEHLGLRLADMWNLPDPLPQVIASHHREPSPGDALEKSRLLVMVCDAAVTLMGFAPPYVPYDFLNLPCVRRLGLDSDSKALTRLRALPREIEQRMTMI
ncbi:MAG: HDOD domain-containing protein [Phycisphaerae bacterium]